MAKNIHKNLSLFVYDNFIGPDNMEIQIFTISVLLVLWLVLSIDKKQTKIYWELGRRIRLVISITKPS